jgi:hypothetical protein
MRQSSSASRRLQNRIFGSKTPAFNDARHKRISPLHLRYSALNLVADASAHQRVPAKNHRCLTNKSVISGCMRSVWFHAASAHCKRSSNLAGDCPGVLVKEALI